MSVPMGAAAGPFQCVGYRWHLTGDDAAVVDEVSTLYRACYDPSGPPGQALTVAGSGDGLSLSVDGHVVLDHAAAGHVVAHLAWEVNRAVTTSGWDTALLHAAAAQRGSSVVMLSGPKRAGKSTLVAALVAAGLEYVTDEAVAVDHESGRVVPYPKPLSVKRGSWGTLSGVLHGVNPAIGDAVDQLLVPPESIRPDSVVVNPGRVTTIVFPQFVRGAASRLDPIPRAAATIALCEQTLNLEELGAEALSLVAAVVGECDCYRLEYGDAHDACRVVLDVMDAEPPSHAVAPKAVAGSPHLVSGELPGGQAVPRRAAGVVWVAVDDDLVLHDMTERRLHHLNPTAAAVWKACDGRLSIAEITVQLESEFRADGRDVKRDASMLIASLARVGALKLDVADPSL